MFGIERFVEDFTAIDMVNMTKEQAWDEGMKVIRRFGRTNFVAGVVASGIGSITAIVVPKCIKKIKEKKNRKELKDTDK